MLYHIQTSYRHAIYRITYKPALYLGLWPVVACVSALMTCRGSQRADVHVPRALAQSYHIHIKHTQVAFDKHEALYRDHLTS